MEKKIFLIGSTGVGKTRLIREVLEERLSSAGGFVTERSTDGEGRFIGFSLLPAAAAAGVSGYTPELYLDCRSFPPEKHHEAFRQTGVRLLREAVWYPYALLDELGGYELVIPEFSAELQIYLNTPHPCLGALRSLEDAELLRGLLGLSDRYPAKLHTLLDSLERAKDCEVIELRDDNTGEVRSLLEQWCAEYAE